MPHHINGHALETADDNTLLTGFMNKEEKS